MSEGPLSKIIDYLESVRNLILQHNIIVSSIIIVAKVVLECLRSFDLLRAYSEKVTHLVVEYFTFFVFGQACLFQIVLEHLGSRKGKDDILVSGLAAGWHGL